MREHDALGIARRTGGEHDRQEVILADAVDAEQSFEQPQRRSQSINDAQQFVGEPDFREQGFQRGLIRHRSLIGIRSSTSLAGDDVADSSLDDARIELRLAERVVEIDDDATGQG